MSMYIMIMVLHTLVWNENYGRWSSILSNSALVGCLYMHETALVPVVSKF